MTRAFFVLLATTCTVATMAVVGVPGTSAAAAALWPLLVMVAFLYLRGGVR